jgi:hypothetical protein
MSRPFRTRALRRQWPTSWADRSTSCATRPPTLPARFCPVFHGARPVFHGACPEPSPAGVGHFFPVSPFFARVRVGASYMVLPSFQWSAPSFPWRAPRTVPDGRRALFSRVPVFCPCTRPCTSGCLVHGFAQFSMARAQFRPRRASGIFFRVPVFLPVYESVPRTWFCPVLHGARPVSSTAGVGHFVTVYFVPVYPSLMLLACVLATGLIG